VSKEIRVDNDRSKFPGDPIFVGGEHRSGTTLLAAVLDSHPHVAFGLELDFLEPADLGPHLLACCALLRAGERASLQRGTRLAEFHWGVQFTRQCDAFGVGPDVLESLVRRTMKERRCDLSRFGDRCALVNAVGEWRRAELGVGRWGFKVQRQITRADAFAECWPRARFVHIVRDGRDVAASHVCSHSDWGYRDVRSAAAGWSTLVEATRGLRTWPPFYEFRYEDLVHDPRGTLGRLLEFLGLPWNESVLAHARAGHTFLKPDGYDHPSTDAVRRPISGGTVRRFRRDLSRDDVRTIEAVAGPWLVALGYALEA
jgi:hypothetical protein